jgi:hypothetical protein
MWWPPQPWSQPSPLAAKVRPKSLAVKVVTQSATPICVVTLSK